MSFQTKTAGSRDAGLPYSRIPLTAPHPPGNRNHHFDRPWLVRHDDHPGRFRRAGLLIEQSHASDEGIHVATPVRMIRKDEVPTAALCLIHACSPRPPPARFCDGRVTFFWQPSQRQYAYATPGGASCSQRRGVDVGMAGVHPEPHETGARAAGRTMAAMRSEDLLYERPAETAQMWPSFKAGTYRAAAIPDVTALLVT